MGSDRRPVRGYPQERRITSRTGNRLWRVALVMAMLPLVSACISIVEPPGPPSTSTPYQDDIHLTAAAPVAVRHLTFEVTPPKRTLNASLELWATKIGTETPYEFSEGLTVSVVPDDIAALGAVGSGWHYGKLPGSTLNLNDYCADGCRGGISVILRGAQAGAEEDIRLFAELRASGLYGNQDPLGTTLTITGDADPRFDGAPPSVVADITRTIEVSEASPEAHLELQLHIDAAPLAAPIEYPLVGSLVLRAAGVGAAKDLFIDTHSLSLGLVSVNGTAYALGNGGPVDADWLRFCTASRACDVTIGIDVTYERLSTAARVTAATDNRTLETVPSSITLEVVAQARLEAFDARSLPAGSLALTSD